MEDLLVSVVDQLVFKHSLCLVSPQSNQEQLGSDLVLQVETVLNDVVFGLLGHSADPLEDSGQLSDVEDVMELQGSGQDSPPDLFPQLDGGVNEDVLHVDDFLRVLLGIEEHFQDLAVNVLDRSLRRRSHVEREELSLQSVRDVVSSSSWVVHGAQELQVLDGSEVPSVVLGQEVESLLVHELSGDFQSDLVAPVVHKRHGHVVQEHSHFLSSGRLEGP